MKIKKLHSWGLNPKQAVDIQERLREKIKITNLKIKPQLVAAADVAFKDGVALGAVVLMSLVDLKIIEWVQKSDKIRFPYIPGLLTFREGPVLEKCFRALQKEPDVIIFDGQGIAHPRNMGLATHMGMLLDKPTIGCAKTRLWGNFVEPAKSRGSFSYLLDDSGRHLGAVLRTRDNTRPVYVSAGYKIDLKSAIKIILMSSVRYRLPQPLRLAHQLSSVEKSQRNMYKNS